MKKLVFATLALTCSAIVHAAPPPAPQITVAATDIRQLEFNWTPVVGAQSYELWFRAAPGAEWVKYREQSSRRAPLFRIGISVHLLDWQQARYYVRACNTGGCTASNVVGVNGERLAAMGFIKHTSPSNTRYFGGHVAASADGKTFAVLASERFPAANGAATIHVYRKTTASSGWRREARLVPANPQHGIHQPFVGDQLAISGDGNVIVFGGWPENDENPDSDIYQIGSVHVFRHNAGTWARTQRIFFSETSADWFGFEVKLDDAARTLAVTHLYSGEEYRPGTVEIYRHVPEDGNGQFVHETSIPTPAAYTDEEPMTCKSIALSGDGRKLFRFCGTTDESYVQVFDAPGWSESARFSTEWTFGIDVTFDGSMAMTQGLTFADVWKGATGTWVHDGRLGNVSGVPLYTHRSIAISRDGKIAALGNPGEYSRGIGPIYPPYSPGVEHDPSGGVVIWERKPAGWVLRRLVKPGSPHEGAAGTAVALADNGRLLIVGAPQDPSAATGFDGDRQDASAPDRGAVWVY